MGWEWISFLAAATTVFAGCLAPAKWLPPLPNDKLLHFLAFGGLTLLAGRIAQNGQQQFAWIVGLFLAGWAIECLQILVPGRRFCWHDIAANTAGILLAAPAAVIMIGN